MNTQTKIRNSRFSEQCYEESSSGLLCGVDWLIVTEVSKDCNDYIFRVQSKKSDKDILILGKVSHSLPVDKVQHSRELESSEKKMMMKPQKLPPLNFVI